MLLRLVLVLCEVLSATGVRLRTMLTVDKVWPIHSEWTILSGPLPDRKAEHDIEGKEYRVDDVGFTMLTIDRSLRPER